MCRAFSRGMHHLDRNSAGLEHLSVPHASEPARGIVAMSSIYALPSALARVRQETIDDSWIRLGPGHADFTYHSGAAEVSMLVPSHDAHSHCCNHQPDRCSQGHRADGPRLVGAPLQDMQTEGSEHDNRCQENCH